MTTSAVAQASEHEFSFLWHLKQCVQSLPFVGVIVKPCFTALVAYNLTSVLPLMASSRVGLAIVAIDNPCIAIK